MLSCDEALNLLSAYYDGELGVAASNQVKEHLCACEECSKVLEDMAFLSSAVSKIDFPKVDDAFAKSLHEKLEKKADRPKKYYKIMRAIRPYAAVAASLAIVIGIYAAHNKANIGVQNEIPFEIRSLEIQNSTADDAFLEDNKTADAVKEDTAAPTPARQRAVTNNKNMTVYDDSKTITKAEENNEEKALQQETINEEPQAVQAYESYDEEHGALPASYSEDAEKENVDIAEKEIELVYARFKLSDILQKEKIISILEMYGTPQVSDTNINLQILAANYNACIEVLQSVEGLDKYEETPVDDGEEYCYIDIELQQKEMNTL